MKKRDMKKVYKHGFKKKPLPKEKPQNEVASEKKSMLDEIAGKFMAKENMKVSLLEYKPVDNFVQYEFEGKLHKAPVTWEGK